MGQVAEGPAGVNMFMHNNTRALAHLAWRTRTDAAGVGLNHAICFQLDKGFCPGLGRVFPRSGGSDVISIGSNPDSNRAFGGVLEEI